MLSRDQLIEIRNQASPQSVSRSVRKTLFKYNLWCPLAKRTGTLKTNFTQCKKGKSGERDECSGTKCAILNSRSINNKEDSIYELIVDNSLDFLALTETWCSDNSTVSLGHITPPGYYIIQTQRPTRGGGVALIFRDTYNRRRVNTGKYETFEHQTVSLHSTNVTLCVTTIYVPNGIFSTDFNDQFSDLLSKLVAVSGKHVIVGDFNFRINESTDQNALKFKTLIEQFNLTQHIDIPTHVAGNTLDLVLTRDDLSVKSIHTDNSVNSNHSAVLFTISCTSPGVAQKNITYREWRSADVTSIQADISDAFSDFSCQDVSTGVQIYNATLADIVEKHAPEKSRLVTVRPDNSWYTADLSKEKRLRRKLERKFKQTQSAADKLVLQTQRNKYNNLLTTTKKDYFKTKITNAQSSKELYKICDRLLNREKTSVLPTHECAESLANKFVEYFNDKIELIRSNLNDSLNHSTTQEVSYDKLFSGVPFENFTEVSEADVRKIISSSPTKSCALDPVPTWLLKQCQDQLVPVLTCIVNASLSCADFPKELKKAFLTPLIKKLTLDCEILKNYRPVSNLSFISKLIERIVCVQLIEHLEANGLYELFQSAYRQLHSTETALLRVQNDLLQAVDTEGGAILVLLDLSAAFDTIDHQKLLNLLDRSFGIKGSALKWFESYLKERTQTVQVGAAKSKPVTLKYGVPQGSVLGPVLFTIYTAPLGDIIRSHGLSFHLYADDTQLYIAFKPGASMSRETAISRIEACIKDIRAWMTNNLLKLNDDKTELIVITTSTKTSQNQNVVINVGDSLITPGETPARNLGVLFDSTCSLREHVSKLCKSINYNLYSVGKIRKYLDKPTAEKIINSTVTSRLDYCNSLLYGAKDCILSPLQRCQNNAARIVSMRRKFDHITPVLKELHWLPVKQRIQYKILLLTYKALHGKAPAYLTQLLSNYSPSRPLRSQEKLLLTVPRCRLEGFGRRCFANAAPTLWNPLPSSVKCASSVDSFKCRLKTHLFCQAYP